MDKNFITETLPFFRLEGTRIIYLNGVVDDAMAAWFNITLIKMESEAPDEDIIVYINSPGGSVPAGLSMIDTMDMVSCDVSTMCIGTAASMGAMLLMAGTKGKRHCLKHSTVLIHQPLQSFAGTCQVTDMALMTKEAIKCREILYDLIHDCTGQDLSRIEEDCERDYVMHAEDAIAYGIIDSVLKPHRR